MRSQIRATTRDDTTYLATRPNELQALGLHAVYATRIVTRRVGGQTERYLDTAHQLTHL